jgi:hypothetical protein
MFDEPNFWDRRRLKKIIRATVSQGNHKNRITQLYRDVRSAAMAEFTEDNQLTLDSFLRECFEASMKEHELTS